MRNNIITVSVTIIILLFLLTGCGKVPETNECGVYIPKYEDMAKAADNVYIGQVISISSETQVGFMSDNTEHLVETIEYSVKITEVLKGDYIENSEIIDLVCAEFKDYLQEGCSYVFCTGIDYGNVTKNGLILAYHPYCAVKLNNDDTVEVFRWEEYESKYSSSSENFIISPPKNVQEIRVIVNNILMPVTYAN